MSGKQILITGASGLLGAHLGIHLSGRRYKVQGTFLSCPRMLPFASVRLDLREGDEVRAAVEMLRPDVVVYAAALSKVLECERDPERAEAINVGGTRSLLNAVGRDCHFILLSTDQVFDGEHGPYAESDSPQPTHVYGRTKRAAELLVQERATRALILRSNNLLGRNAGWGESFSDGILRGLRREESFELFTDQLRSPLHVRDMVQLIERCIVEERTGVLHAGGPQVLSRFESGRLVAEAYGVSGARLIPSSMMRHAQAHLLHRDGTFETRQLRQSYPEIGTRTVLEGLREDAARELLEQTT